MARCIPKAEVGSMSALDKALARSCTSPLRRIHRSTSRSIEINSSFPLILIIYKTITSPPRSGISCIKVSTIRSVKRSEKERVRDFDIRSCFVVFLNISIEYDDIIVASIFFFSFFSLPSSLFLEHRCYVMPRNDVIVCYVVSVNLKAGIDEWSLYSVLAFLLRLDGREGDKWESLFPLWKRDALCSMYNINIEAYNSQSVLLNTVFLVIIVNNSKLFVKDIYFIHRCVYRNIRYSPVLISFEVFYQFENNGSTNDLFKTHLSI